MKYETVTSDRELSDYCRGLSSVPWIAFDTEFVAEFTYRPELCLVQVSTEAGLAVIDPVDIDDMGPFWQALAEGEHETIVHAGREEVGFSLEAVGDPPAGMLDIQIAAGMIGLEYPASYGNLIQKLLGKKLSKGETRTDWRRRPLSKRQIEYALNDVRYLKPLRDKLVERLEELDRKDWLADEMQSFLDEVREARSRQRWRRTSGCSGLNSRGLAIVRELWLWREGEAQRRNLPPRRVLRDDLIVELARRQTSDPQRIQALRGMNRRDLKRTVGDLSKAIERALALPEEDCPKSGRRRDAGANFTVVGQFLTTALGSVCRAAEIAPSIVGTTSDVRELVAYELGERSPDEDEELPKLARGWRAQIVGRTLERLLLGELVVRVTNPRSDEPLTFEEG